MNLGNQKGLTLVEVLASIVISVICVTGFLQLAMSGRMHKTDTDRSLVLKEILTNNAIELKSRPLEDLPAPASCLVRYYDLLGKFLEESLLKTPGDFCHADPPPQDRIQVIWQIMEPSAIAAHFSVPALKIPELSSHLKKATLYVRGYTHAGSTSLLSNQITIFKR